MPVESTAHISDGIIEMYNIAAAVLQAPPGSLNDHEENFLCAFVQSYWEEYPDRYADRPHEDPLND